MSKIRSLPAQLEKLATEELNEIPNQIDSYIENLREWIQKQPHLKARTSDQFLIAFLRGSKYSLEKAKFKIDKYYTLRTAIPELFTNRDIDDPKIMEILRLGVGFWITQKSNDNDDFGPCISIVRPGAYDAKKYTFLDVLKVGTMVGDIGLLEDDNAIICGHIEILDLANVTADHFFQLDMTILKKLTILGQEATPLRHKGFHVINAPPGAETIFNIFKGFMNEKQRGRFFIHGKDWKTLHEFVPKNRLPVEYGGNRGSINDILNYWENKLLEYRDYFKDDINYGTIESLRKGPPVNSETLFGLDGSFRKLEVD